MKARNTFILLIVALGLAAYVKYYESKQPTTDEALQNATRVVDVDTDAIDGINIVNNEEKIGLRKINGHWQLDTPVKDRADDAVVGQLLSGVQDLQKVSDIQGETAKNDVRDFGLVKPNVTLQLTGSGAPPEILFGKDTAIEGKEYIRLGNSDTIYIVSTDLHNQVAKKAGDFRARQLSDVNASQVTAVTIKVPAGEIELQKNQDHWEIEKPIKARGDDAKIDDLVAQTLNTRIDSFPTGDQEIAAANTALGDAQGSVTVTADGVEKPLVLQLSKPLATGTGHVYAKLSTRDSAFILPAAAASILTTMPNDVRDKHLVRLNLDTVDRIHVAPAGAPEILLARKGEDWTIKSLGDKPANSGDVQKMVQALQTQQVVAFVSDVATDLAEYGLDRPALKIVFSAYASEPTAESAAGEQPLDTILFGKTDGDNVYAKLEDEPFIVSVPKAILQGIYTDPIEWQDLAIYKLKADDITSLDITVDSQATLSLVKEKGEWKPAKGDIGLNTAAIQSLANTLSTLRAVQWAGAIQPAQGLAKPAVTVAFSTAADKTPHTIQIGNPAGDYWYASADGRPGAFEISRPDHDSFIADFLRAVKVAPPAGATSPEPPATIITPATQAH